MSKRSPKPGEWQYTVGEVPAQLTAFERADRGNAIYYRVWDGRRYEPRNRYLHEPIRDARGKIDADLMLSAQKAANEQQAAIAAGVRPAADGPLTLEVGFRKLLDRKRGKYAGDTEWRSDVQRYAQTIVDILGASLLWKDVRHSHYRQLWRELARRHRDNGEFGPRAAVVIVGVLRSCAVWLQQEGFLEPGTGLPAPKWAELLKSEWADITQKPVGKPRRPRYTVEEQQKLWDALPDADPRIELAIEIGAEKRLGQVARSRRSDIKPHGGFRIGCVEVHGRGKKRGAPVILTMRQRHVLIRAMTSGVLADLETAYQAGEIGDYYLVPGGYLRTVTDRKGRRVRRAQVKHANERFHRSAMRKAWRALEQLAGIEHVAGRNWYGLRRLHADLAERQPIAPVVKNRLGGWTNTETREMYLHEDDPEVAAETRRALEKLRPQKRKSRKVAPKNYPTGETVGQDTSDKERDNNDLR